MIARKAAPAIAAGCAFVARPAAETPLSALAMAVLADRAGLPKGVLSVITSKRASDIGKEFCENPTVRKLTFTGSTEVGRILLKQAADQVMKCSMELGGNAPFIVFDDADLDAAVVGAMASKFRNNGQTCVCANRIYVQAGVYDAFAARLSAAVAKLNVGDGLKDGVDTGPLVNMDAVDKVEEHIADILTKGGTVVTGGKRHALGGSFFEPTIVTGVTQDMLVSQEETFGPLAPLFRFETEEEVIAKANDTIFGLASYFYARDIGRITRVQEALEYGMVGVNTGLISTEVAPFGGIKQSGLGREGSRHGMEDYMEMKYICLSVLSHAARTATRCAPRPYVAILSAVTCPWPGNRLQGHLHGPARCRTGANLCYSASASCSAAACGRRITVTLQGACATTWLDTDPR
jgi:succinate-semialdehyde dehydrogenase/glutarate-semialdehyde dehydrogenase